MNQYQQFPPSPQPPMMYEQMPPPRSAWPQVIGIISIILASFGLMCYGCNSAATIMQPWMTNMTPPGQQPVAMQGAQLALTIINVCASFLLSLLMLIGGIGLMMRRYWSVAALKIWSVLRILNALLALALGFIYLEEMMQQINDQFAQQSMTLPMTFTSGVMIVIIILSFFIALIWPAFLLIWFARSSIRHERESWASPMRGGMQVLLPCV